MSNQPDFNNRNYHNTYLNAELDRRYLDYVNKRPISIFTGTWNVNGKEPSENVQSWLRPLPKFDADVYALAFQEIVDLNAANIILDNDADQSWERHVAAFLPPDKYELLLSERLVGILLLVYVKKRELHPFCRDEMKSKVGVGLFGHVGNKGGVGIRFKIWNSTLCFVSTHLAAHKKNVQGRNQDFAKIFQHLKFPGKDYDLHLLDHDFVFWLGDLNYRLNSEDLEGVYSLIEKNDIGELLKIDQLSVERQAGHVFRDFSEAKVEFLPSYKFTPGTDDYDRRAEGKMRFPAWCDRILWRKGETNTCKKDDVTCIAYGSSWGQRMSDHKPVYCLFRLEANEIDTVRLSDVKKMITRRLDKEQNRLIMKVDVPAEHIFRDVKFGEPMTIQFEVTNTGQVPAVFHTKIASHEDDNSREHPRPRWLYCEPRRARVPIGGSKTITLTAHVVRECVQQVSFVQKNRLDDIIVFSLQNGADTFITISGNYQPSCFGQTIEKLVRIRKPISFVNLDDLTEPEKFLCMPKELWRLVDYIYKFGMDEEHLFRPKGIAREVSDIREGLDNGKEFERPSIHSMAEALIRFLESLIDPVFHYSYCTGFEDTDLTQFCKDKLMNLPISHYNTFIYVISFLREVLKHGAKNKCNPKKLAYQFSSALMRAPMPQIAEQDLPHYGPFRVLYHFITSNELGSR